jgi:hydroxypyruvate isomerase
VEFLFPYAYESREIRARLTDFDLQPVLHNLPPGDWDAGERGIACIPGREREFRESVARGIASAQALGVPQLNCLAGIAPAGVPAETLRATLLKNLSYAAGEFRSAGLRLLIEPINTFDMPGFYLNRTAQALELIDAIGSDNIFVQYDIYHAQRTEGDIAQTLAAHLDRISHIQIADNPGRHEPGTGELNWPFLFAHLDAIGYTRWVGCEYRPAAGTVQGLGWLRTLAQ